MFALLLCCRIFRPRSQSLSCKKKSVGQGSRDQALAQPWTGSESLHDVNLRMLDDSRKRLRIGRSTASLPPLGQPRSSTRKPSSNSAGQRLANARDKTSIYSATNQSDSPMSEEERAQIKKELKERFSPGARAMPTTLQGLTSLANERIEDAISRGQFKDIPRGKGTNVAGQDGQSNQAMSPFLDTTEYLMNRIIQRQEIVPPWIEKQQELRRSTDIFRSRLRNDWKRHVARVIASQGGSLESQVRRAEEHSLAEQRLNGTEKESLQPGGTDVAGKAEEGAHFSQINGQGELTITGDVTTISTEAKKRQISLPTGSSTPSSLPVLPTSASQATPPSSASSLSTSTSATESTYLPFRDPTYLQTESSYHKLTIEHLNTLTRSYNLVAPRPAQKPYLSLQIELKRCYADVAPLVADEIRERASRGVCREERRRRTSRITSRGGGAATAAANEIGIFGRMGWHGAAANGEEDEENDDHNDDDDNVDDDDSDYGPFSRERKEQVKKRNAAGDQQKQQQQQQQKQWRWSGHSTSQSRLRRREEDLQKNGYGFKQLWKDLVGSFTTVRE